MPVRTPADLGATIYSRRRALGLDQRELAEKVGVSRKWIVEVEKGKPGAAIGLILRTLRVLGLSTEISEEKKAPRRSGSIDVEAIFDAVRKPRT